MRSSIDARSARSRLSHRPKLEHLEHRLAPGSLLDFSGIWVLPALDPFGADTERGNVVRRRR